MTYTTQEMIAHVLRRLGMGANPDAVADLGTVDEAIGLAFDLGRPPPEPPPLETPADLEAAREQDISTQASWWVERMASGERMIEERLVWFWMDHFATSRRKVPADYLLWQQHLTIRSHAIGSFADLLAAIARDPAMLFYLDGVSNQADNPNENFAREVMELYSLGVGNYTQADIGEAARAFTGWVVNIPGNRYSPLAERFGIGDWQSGQIGRRHDNGSKTIFGSVADHDLTSTIDLLLEQPATADHIAAKLYRELVGISPDPATVATLGDGFRADYQILPLVEAIVARPEFTDDAAVRSKVRTPLEKAITVVQAFPDEASLERVSQTLRLAAYVPFLPPNPAGYPKGEALLGPYQLTHSLDLLWLAPRDLEPLTTANALAGLGVYDVSASTVGVIDNFDDPHSKLASVLASPEFILT